MPETNSTHRAKRTPEYSVWIGMLTRCYNPHEHKFHLYGGRGILVCDRWRYGEDGDGPFECFLADVGYRPANTTKSARSEFSIDRIDSDGNYEPSNVRWATKEQQAQNKRTYKHGIQRAKRGKFFRVRIGDRWHQFNTFEQASAAVAMR